MWWRTVASWRALLLLVLAVLLASVCALPAAATRLTDFLLKVTPAAIFPSADRLGLPQGNPPIAPAYAGDRLLGHVWLNADVTDATGYSGKPILMLVAADTEGVIRGIRLVEHHEPIVLLGIPERRVVEAVNSLVGTAIGARCARAGAPAAGRYRERRDRHCRW